MTGDGRSNVLIGGEGDDAPAGNKGADTQTGGVSSGRMANQDVFVFEELGSDAIADFKDGKDKIRVIGAGADYGDLTAMVSGSGITVE